MALLGRLHGRGSVRAEQFDKRSRHYYHARQALQRLAFGGVVYGQRRAAGPAALSTLLLLCAAPSAPAASCEVRAAIVFARGASAAQVTGAVPRGTRACWTLKAHAGQHLSARVESLGDNAVFQIYLPGSAIIAGEPSPGSKPLDNTVIEGKDARSFSGKLPQTGEYLFVVGATWGGSEYKLEVRVTN
jgi:hypothetical protein